MANNTLTGTLNWSLPFFEYQPMTAGINLEPAITNASVIRNTIMTPPMTWPWNRVEDSSQSTTLVTGSQTNFNQDYVYQITNFGFLEKCSVIDSTGRPWEVPTVYNTAALAKGGASQRPTQVAVIANNPGVGFTIRFMGIPDQVYQIVLTYQTLAVQFAAAPITSVVTASGGNTQYIGTFNPALLIAGQSALVANLKIAANNGSFPIVSCNATTLVLANPSGAAETDPGLAINQSWAPIPDSYSDIYNNLFLGEAFAAVDDVRSEIYRRRGVAAFLAKQDGLTDTQKNVFAQQWLSQAREAASVTLKLQQGTQGRGI
jgi:hypothetical protein